MPEKLCYASAHIAATNGWASVPAASLHPPASHKNVKSSVPASPAQSFSIRATMQYVPSPSPAAYAAPLKLRYPYVSTAVPFGRAFKIVFSKGVADASAALVSKSGHPTPVASTPHPAVAHATSTIGTCSGETSVEQSAIPVAIACIFDFLAESRALE